MHVRAEGSHVVTLMKAVAQLHALCKSRTLGALMPLCLPANDILGHEKHRLLAERGWTLNIDLDTYSEQQLLGIARIACLTEAELYFLVDAQCFDHELNRRNEDAALSTLQHALLRGPP